MNIAVAGTGYVGLSIATLLSQRHHVEAVDIMPEKVDMINRRQSPIVDRDIEDYLSSRQLDLHATLDAGAAYEQAQFVVVATPTNYDPRLNTFDTSAVEQVVSMVTECNPQAFIVIKSTVPVGYTEHIRKTTGTPRIMFSPEFLRESKALYDNLHPSRVIVGADTATPEMADAARQFADLLKEAALTPDVPTLIMPSTEAEAVKWFANT